MSVAALLTRLGLDQYADTFEDEAITDTSLLISMGPEMLRDNLEELGLDAAAVDALADELFGAPAQETELQLEDNVAELSLHRPTPPVPSGGDAARAPPHSHADVTEEELRATEIEAQWLLNPMSMVDLSHAKSTLLQLMTEGVAFQKAGQFANARAAFTKALALEVPKPNKRMTAALYYNRAACQRQLGQLSLALRDAQLAAETDASNLRAWWRAADVAIVLGDRASAMEAVAAGLERDPRCAPLLQLRLQLKRED